MSPKLRRIASVAILVVILTLGGVYLTYLFNHTTIMPKKPSGEQVNLDLTPLTSYVHAPFTLPNSVIGDKLEKAIPTNFTGTAKDNEHKDRRIAYNFNRSTIGISTDISAKRLRASSSFSGRAQVSDRENLIVKHIDWSVGLEGKGRIEVSTSPLVKSDWSIDPRLEVNGSADAVAIKTPVGNIGVTNLVKDAVRNSIQSKSGEISAELARQLQFKNLATKFWTTLPTVVKVSEAPETWVRLSPKSVGLKTSSTLTTASKQELRSV